MMDYYSEGYTDEELVMPQPKKMRLTAQENEAENVIDLEEVENFQKDAFCRVLNKVYEHLSIEDMLRCSLVSKAWQEIIGKLETFIQRSKLIIFYDSNNVTQQIRENLSAVEKSNRIYQNIEVEVRNSKMDNKLAENLVTKYSMFLRQLKLIKFGGHKAILNRPLIMPNLRELELQAVGGRLSGKFLTNVTTLERITINAIEPDMLTCLLINNPDLKELTIYENAFISYFKKDISSNVKFQLTKLQILDHYNQELRLDGEFPAQNWSSNQRINFLKLLSTQTSLRSLHLDACNADIVPAILLIGTLELLEINKIVGHLSREGQRYSNNIETFLTNSKEMKITTIEILLSMLPTVQSLFINRISSEDDILKLLDVKEEICKDLQNFYFCEGSDLSAVKGSYKGSVNVKQSTKVEFINLFGS